MNDYTTSGKYYAGTASVAQSLENCPSTAAFALYVFAIASASYQGQIVFANISEGYIYYRLLRSAGWTGWYQIGTTAISTSGVGDPVVMEDEESAD